MMLNITLQHYLFSNESLSDMKTFMVEASGSAVIDTACTRIVCVEKWLDDYVSELPQSELQKMNDKKTPFRFLSDKKSDYSSQARTD